MSNWKNKVGKIALATAVTGGLLAGCSQGEKPGSSSDAKEDGVVLGQKEVTLNMMTFSHTNWPYKEDWPVYRYLKEKTGISFKVQPVMNDYSTTMNLAISSGEVPDLMMVNSLSAANTHGESGAFINFFDHLDQMPNYKKFLDEHPEVKASILSPDGKNYFLPLYGLEQQSRRSWLYRDDVFKKHDLKPPTTYDELYTVAKKLKELYPDSYPLAVFNGLSPLINMAPAFGTHSDFYYDEAKKEWRYGPTEDNYKLMVSYMNRFYKEGLVAPDFMAHKRKQFNDLLLQNKAFIASDYIGIMDELPLTLGEKASAFSLDYMNPPVGSPEGKSQNMLAGFMGDGFAIASKSKERDLLLKYVDFLFSEEGIELVTWGKEGETFKTENGVRKFNEDYKEFGDLRKKTGLATTGAHFVLDMKAYDSLYSPKMREAMKKIGNHETKAQPRLSYTNEENEVLSMVGATVKKYREEQVAKFILGQKSLDEWDAYVKESNQLGVQKVLDVHKGAHDRTLKFLNEAK
ncbi:putative aldouronate transport system substrate-binding protein [Paenibacillus sp. UNCCL117]|uniref:extracellular solute-binding protein n=1 Tax=unclassified Paenibacillus TaxID=185978 RepID=UPI0008815B49|nr:MULTISPECIES: extracellular solute-binding protein [unclassified Paenibacillus]SDE15472.1 carbohydrate ABC transporter substrate-binding protein, CUT1 family [Paenibacillus sp. cl123]SFW60902.1 putative aldouronate transport system substrate-binding protein [Paenibacillus sp. UNCCL117]